MILFLSAVFALTPGFIVVAAAMDTPCPLDPRPTRARIAYGARIVVAVLFSAALSMVLFSGAVVALSIGQGG